MNLEIIFRKDDNKEWELLGIFADETEKEVPQGVLRDVFFKYKVIDYIFEFLKENDSEEHKTAFSRIKCPIEDSSRMMIAYSPFTIDEMSEKIKEQQS